MELDDASEYPSSAITAIAKVDTMLELIPVSQDVKLMLEGVLPLYDAPGELSTDEADSYFLSHSTSVSKAALLSDIPAPDPQCQKAWCDLLAFQCEGHCAKPSASTLLAVWQCIISDATLERRDLTADVDLKSFFRDEQASMVHEYVAEAIQSYLDDEATPEPAQRLDRRRTIKWTGSVLLQARSETPGPSSPLLRTDFFSQWQDRLPEAWREDVKMEELPEGCCTIVVVGGQEMITWNGSDDSGAGSTPVAISEVAGETSGKRKWHDKFKAQRKEVKK